MQNEEQNEDSSSPKIAIALFDYEARDDDELNMSENDNLMVLDDSDPEWVRVRLISKNGGGEGLVPRSYIEFREPGQTDESHVEPPPPEVSYIIYII